MSTAKKKRVRIRERATVYVDGTPRTGGHELELDAGDADALIEQRLAEPAEDQAADEKPPTGRRRRSS